LMNLAESQLAQCFRESGFDSFVSLASRWRPPPLRFVIRPQRRPLSPKISTGTPLAPAAPVQNTQNAVEARPRNPLKPLEPGTQQTVDARSVPAVNATTTLYTQKFMPLILNR
jgi:hypothetical protein